MTEHQIPTPPQAASTRPGRAARPIMIATACVGGLALLGIGTSAAYSAAGTRVASVSDASATSISVDGITDLDLDLSIAEFTLEYGPVDEAELRVAGTHTDRWVLKRDRDTLVVASPSRLGGGSCFLGFCPPDRTARMTGTLTLPEELRQRPLNTEVEVSVGSFTADGSFGDVSVDVGAGEATIAGAASTLEVTVGVGTFTGELSDVSAAAFEVSLGEIRTTLSGDAPDTITAEVGTGSIDLRLPDEDYRVDASVELGDVTNRLRTSSDAKHLITADVSLGELTLRPLR
ncbi:hypothetical protein [Leucobacter luti]|uniref:Adhesin n=1 Tax=Leucobacter luti TaxID=340320 RepID=A0A4Q7U4F2_9MICO|nr:hypothetical protein [Leucobacter luti]MBL3699511.1 hypothetical protein [Leucobacter luti]RZT67022.1 hypothetical protein EV139_1153 [Leucobacter luti]